MERNLYHEADFEIVERPGMYEDRNDALNGVRGLLVALGLSLVIVAVIVLAIKFAASHERFVASLFVAAGFLAAASVCWGIVRNPAKYDLVTRIICGITGVASVLLAVFSSGVFR